ncbi:MAG: hypothetical protein P1V18_00800 [Candidatus Gracilibacteria bacterium]|nr:hypothetical protein [Candidatus Gracilibacteria bacterium]
MRKAERAERIESLKTPRKGDEMGKGWRALKKWWEDPGVFHRGVRHAMQVATDVRAQIAKRCRMVDDYTYTPVRQAYVDFMGSSLEEKEDETTKRKNIMEELYAPDSEHEEDARVQQMESLFNKLKDVTQEAELREKNDPLKNEADAWFKKRLSTGLNKIRSKYGPGRDLTLYEDKEGPLADEPARGQKRVHQYAKNVAFEALRQEKSNPSGLPPLEYAYMPPVKSLDTDTPESFETRNKEYWENRKNFGFEQIVFQGANYESLLYNADQYLSKLLGSDYKKMNRDGMLNIHIATAEKGEKKSVCIILTGNNSGETPEENIVANNRALQEMATETTPPSSEGFWKNRYESVSQPSIISKYVYNRLDSYYAACVVAQLEKSINEEYVGTEIEKGDVLKKYIVLGSTTKTDAVELNIKLSSGARKFVITKTGLIVTKPQNAGKKKSDAGSEWGSGSDSVMSWKEFFDDLTAKDQPKRVYSPKSSEGLSKFGLESGSFERKDGKFVMTEKADSTDPNGFPIPFGKQDGVKQILIFKGGVSAKLKMVSGSGEKKHKGKYIIEQSDISTILSPGENNVVLQVQLKGGESFSIPDIVINRK